MLVLGHTNGIRFLCKELLTLLLMVKLFGLDMFLLRLKVLQLLLLMDKETIFMALIQLDQMLLIQYMVRKGLLKTESLNDKPK